MSFNLTSMGDLETKLTYATCGSFAIALFVFLVSWFVYGIHWHSTEPLDRYSNYVVIFFCGMSIAYNYARKDIKRFNDNFYLDI